MRFSNYLRGGLVLVAAAAATPALADDAAPAGPTAPPPAITINGTAAIVSDYRFRGVSQTDKNFAVQGSITVTHKSGFYASIWASSVHGYVTAAGDYLHGTTAGQASVEMDLIGGYKKTFSGTTFDIGLLYYVYPKTKLAGDPTSSDFAEPYFDVSHTFGPLTAKATVNYAFKQKPLALNQVGPKKDNVYLAGDFTLAVPKTPVSLTAHIAHSFGPSWLATDATGKKGYTDWNLGATYTWKALTFGISYVDTDARFLTPSGKNASSSGAVGSITASF
ncbi:TorF family putative porin [Sphingomonas sp. GlSt437]|uniref:TorF family putative porin n=1 Tax=Sphingomonas sp. GlSt437 TaxID=3389970 RepID=UPI003A8B8722